MQDALPVEKTGKLGGAGLFPYLLRIILIRK